MKKILYIEDEPEYIDIIKENLEAHNHKLISAGDGEEGLRKISEEKPDLILLDLFLPKVRGFEICKRVKSDPATKDIPIIIITASGVDHLEDQCNAAGARACFTKPYKVRELIAKINEVLK